MRCVRCLYDERHPFGIAIENGICSGCTYHDEKNFLDWDERLHKLLKILDEYRSKNGNFDCIVPITGGQDSFFLAHLVVNVLKMKPILVNFNRNFNSIQGLANLARLRTSFDADFRQLTPNPDVTKKFLRVTLREMGTINWFWIAGQTSLPLRVAIEKSIPLIIWGAHQGNEQVGMYSHLDEVEMTRRYRENFDLMKFDERAISSIAPEIKDRDIESIKYPDDQSIIKGGVRGIYLGNYFRWDPVAQHDFVKKTYGYRGAFHNRTYYKYDNPDCNFYNNIQDYLKYAKYGYSKVTDQLVREIRHGRIARPRALKLKSYFESNLPLNIREFHNWLGSDEISIDLLKLSMSKNLPNDLSTNSSSNIKFSRRLSYATRSLLCKTEKAFLQFRTDDMENVSYGKGRE